MLKFEVELKKPTTPFGNYQTILKIYLFGRLIRRKFMHSYTPDYFK